MARKTRILIGVRYRRRRFYRITWCVPVTDWCSTLWRRFASWRSASVVVGSSCHWITRACSVACTTPAPHRLTSTSSSPHPPSSHWRLNSLSPATTSTLKRIYFQDKQLSKPRFDAIRNIWCTFKNWGL